MNWRRWFGLSVFFCLAMPNLSFAQGSPPNIVLFFADDLGYGDLSCYGSSRIRTPHLDQLARQGTRFTDFYVAQAVCSASRAALLSGCYSNRVGLEGALNHTSPLGIHKEEYLLPEILHDVGYATAIFGKWHLGLPPIFSPLRHGFDQWLGIPYSNDNSKFHPVIPHQMPPLPFFDGETVRETDPDQALFTQRLTDAAIAFISQHRTQPFFVYLPYVMPHVPIFASEKFRGLRNDLYAEVVEELDGSVGRVLAVLDEYGLRENTWVIFSSDNGPFLSYGKHAGETGGLREGKLTAFEGGVRVPCLMRWPGKISADRVCRTPIMTIDLLPTINKLVGSKSPTARIDGIDIGNILFGTEDLPRPHPYLAFYNGNELHAIRSMQWKLHFPHPYLTVDGTPGVNGKPARYGELQPQSINQSGTAGIASRHGYRVEQIPLSLFDLERDPGETTNLSAENPQVIARLSSYADEIRTELGDSLTGKKGLAGQVRPAGGL